MKKYSDYTKNGMEMTTEEIRNIPWTKYKIIVPTEKDKQELMDCFKIFHDSDFDTDIITVNQLVHEYLKGTNIIVDPEYFKAER